MLFTLGGTTYVAMKILNAPCWHYSKEMRLACESLLPPLIETMIDLISRVAPEYQERVRNNVILTGGSGLITGLGAALQLALGEIGGGRVQVVKDPVFVGSDGGLSIAIAPVRLPSPAARS